MKMQHTLILLVAVAVLAWAAGAASSEDEKPAKPLTAAEMEAKAWQMGQAGPEHAHLAQFVGTWTGEDKAYSQMMGEIPVRGTTTNAAIMDGRFIRSAYEGPGPAGTITGAGHIGYNRMAKEYEMTWLMSMGTGITLSRGSYDEKTKTFSFASRSKMLDGTVWPMRVTLRFPSPGTMEEAHHFTPTGGKEMLSFRMTWTKAKKEAPKDG